MNLHRQVISENDITYGAPGHSPQLVDLTLKEIISAGKVTNPYQLFVLGHLATFFKNGLKSVDLDLENPLTFGTNATSTEVKDAFKMLTDAETVQLAQYLLDCIDAGESMLHDAGSSVADWISFVIHKQD